MRTDPHFTTPTIIYADVVEIIISFLASEAHPSWRPYTGAMRSLYTISPESNDVPDPSQKARSALLKCALICREWLKIARRHTFRRWTLSTKTYAGLSAIPVPHVEAVQSRHSSSVGSQQVLQHTTFSSHIRHLLVELDELHLRHEQNTNHGPNKHHRLTIHQQLQDITGAVNKHLHVEEWALRINGCDLSLSFVQLFKELGLQGSGVFKNLTCLEMVDEVLLHTSSAVFAASISTTNLPNLKRLRIEESGWLEREDVQYGCDSCGEEEDELETLAPQANAKTGTQEQLALHLDCLLIDDGLGLANIGWLSDPNTLADLRIQHLQFYVNVVLTSLWTDFFCLIGRISSTLVKLDLGAVRMDKLTNKFSTIVLPNLQTFGITIRCKRQGLTGICYTLHDDEHGFSKLLFAIKESSAMPRLHTIILSISNAHHWILFSSDIGNSRFPPSLGSLPWLRDQAPLNQTNSDGEIKEELSTGVNTTYDGWTSENVVKWEILDDALQQLTRTSTLHQSPNLMPGHDGLKALIIPIWAGTSLLSSEQKQAIDEFLNRKFPKCVSRGVSTVSQDRSIPGWNTWGSEY